MTGCVRILLTISIDLGWMCGDGSLHSTKRAPVSHPGFPVLIWWITDSVLIPLVVTAVDSDGKY